MGGPTEKCEGFIRGRLNLISFGVLLWCRRWMAYADDKLVLVPQHQLCIAFHRAITQQASCHTQVSSIHVVLCYVLAAGLGSNATVRGHTWRGDFVIVPFECFLSTVNYVLTKPPGGHINWRFLFSDGVRMV